MLTVVWRVLSKLVSPLWRTVKVDDEEVLPGGQETHSKGVRHLQGSVVTQLCHDYGLIDDTVYFTGEDVLGGMQLREGDRVNCVALRDGINAGWKALRVEKSSNNWEDDGGTSQENGRMQLQPLIGTVTSFHGDGGYINQTTFFPCSSLLEGFLPMKGDWVQVTYFVNPNKWTTQAQQVAPLRYSRLDKVCVTSVHGNMGVVADRVFFSLDSLLLPAHYRPLPGHLVNLVMVESSQSMYSWRALCMAPCLQCVKLPAILPAEAELKTILENKGGLDVSDYGHFGDLMIGEKRALVLWIQNKGSETHTLKCCEFAGWDTEEQFSLTPAKESTPLNRQRLPEKSLVSGSALKPSGDQSNDAEAREKANVLRETAAPGLRREEMDVTIQPGKRLSIAIACQAKIMGSCAELLLLHFSSFAIGRRLEVTVGSEEENLLQPSTPYSPALSQPISRAPCHVITIAAPKHALRFTKRRLPSFVPSYSVPQALRDSMAGQCDVLVVQPSLGEVLSPSNSHSRFSALLWLEELNAVRELEEFSICGALLRKDADCLHLEVTGLAEGRPSLSIGDRITLTRPQSAGVVMEYVSYVTEIKDEDVSLRVNSEFQRSYLGEPLDIKFSFNRLTMRRLHHALNQTKQFAEILFPSRLTTQPPQWTGTWFDELDPNKSEEDKQTPAQEKEKASSIVADVKSKDGSLPSRPLLRPGHFFNPDLNPPQREAVKRILAGESRPIPYVLFGPPGTGKTITLVETILQVHHFLPGSRVLVCTPSNSAADLLCLRLHGSGFLQPGSLVRINASCRQEECIPEVLRQYSRAGEDIHNASYHRVVVSTCSSAGMFYNIGLQVGHFTHVFLDEAGQATEPESLIPISLASERDGQIVLAGDPCQLGPVVKSKVAAAFGLGVSLLERLMANPLYAKQDAGYDPKLVTKLIYNYRSHEALLTLPSKLFYQDELCFKASRATVDALCQWKHLPKKGFPLLFHGVRGTEMREASNPSWFNPGEAVQVMLYCCQLAKKLYRPVSTSDIGIIAPYKKQCEKIRVLLAKVGLSDIKVGSVEEFQGQEFLVIIISTVRSNESIPCDGWQSALGFLANPKRFNVAITRSKAMLLVVGNPHVLIQDPCFTALLQYCFINGAYLGCDLPPSLKDPPPPAYVTHVDP